eukprot:1161964-Pelagomonas_calceolata.AAC.10
MLSGSNLRCLHCIRHDVHLTCAASTWPSPEDNPFKRIPGSRIGLQRDPCEVSRPIQSCTLRAFNLALSIQLGFVHPTGADDPPGPRYLCFWLSPWPPVSTQDLRILVCYPKRVPSHIKGTDSRRGCYDTKRGPSRKEGAMPQEGCYATMRVLSRKEGAKPQKGCHVIKRVPCHKEGAEPQLGC